MTPQELKNSILQLAIQGRLVSQRAEEGTAEELYNQIQAEKQKLIKAGKIKKEKPLPEITDDEKPFEIPESWKWVRLGEIALVLGGKRIPAGRKLTSENTGHIYIRVSDMKDDSVSVDNLMYVPKDIYPSISRYIIRKEDIYITVAGTIGRVGRIPKELDGANLTENADRIVFSIINQDWFINCLKSNVIQSQITDVTTKVGQPKLAIKRIQELLLPIPPLDEQKRIVDKIEELLPYVERYEKAYNELQQLNKRFPGDLQKSVLQLAIQGRLVPQRAEEGTAEELYNKIQAEKQKLIKADKIKKEKPLPAITDNEKPFEIPDSWKWVRLGDLGFYKKGPFGSALTKSMFVPKGNDAIKVYEQKNAIKKDVKLGEYYIKREYFEEKMKGFELFAGDIIVSCAGTIGETYVIPDNFERGIINQALMKIKLFEPTYVSYFLMYFDFILKKNAKMNSKGSAIKNIPPFEILKKYLVPLSPLAEQKRIVAKLEEILPLCDKLKG